jgi:N-acetylglutamate synthase-like GNAT family acetyltransferase
MTDRIRQAAVSDLPGVIELLRESGLPVAGVEESFGDFVVADDDNGMIIGAAGLEMYQGAALLRSVVVAPSYRGSGIGVQLVEHLMATAAARGVAQLILLTTTAAPFFERFGFAETTRDAVPDAVKQSVEFREACPSTATTMVRRVVTPVDWPESSAAEGLV